MPERSEASARGLGAAAPYNKAKKAEKGSPEVVRVGDWGPARTPFVLDKVNLVQLTRWGDHKGGCPPLIKEVWGSLRGQCPLIKKIRFSA